MRIGLVIESLDPRRGGAEQWTYQFAHWLVAAGHEVHVVASRFALTAQQSGLVAHLLPGQPSRIEFAEAARHKLDSLGLDVIHDMGYGWHCDVFQPHGGSRQAAFEQNLLMLPPWIRNLKRRAAGWLPRYREFDALLRRQYADDGRVFVAISQMVANDLQRFHRVRREQIRLVYNGVDVMRFSPERRGRLRATTRRNLGVDEHQVLVAIVAHNFRLKGVPVLLAAVGRLAIQGLPVRLAVIGGQPHQGWFRLANRCRAGSVTTFVGSVDDAEPYYAAADVYAQPTFYDPCSLVLLEALASGLPVVTSRFNGAGELVTEGLEGFVMANPADTDRLADRLRTLMDPVVRSHMSAAARRLALHHTFERNCREILTVYEQIASRRRQAA